MPDVDPGKIAWYAGFSGLLLAWNSVTCAVTLPSTAGNVFEVVGRFLTFDCAGLPDLVGFFLFVVGVLPWLFFLVSLVSGSTVAGVVVTGLAAVGAFFASVFT